MCMNCTSNPDRASINKKTIGQITIFPEYFCGKQTISINPSSKGTDDVKYREPVVILVSDLSVNFVIRTPVYKFTSFF